MPWAWRPVADACQVPAPPYRRRKNPRPAVWPWATTPPSGPRAIVPLALRPPAATPFGPATAPRLPPRLTMSDFIAIGALGNGATCFAAPRGSAVGTYGRAASHQLRRARRRRRSALLRRCRWLRVRQLPRHWGLHQRLLHRRSRARSLCRWDRGKLRLMHRAASGGAIVGGRESTCAA